MANFSLKIKLIMLVVFMQLLLVCVGVLGFFGLKSVVSDYNHVSTINLPNLDKIGRMSNAVFGIHGGMLYIAADFANTDKKAQIIERSKSLIEQYETADREYSQIPFVEGEEEVYKPVNESWKQIKEQALSLFKIALKSDTTVDQMEFQESAMKLSPRVDQFTELYEKLKVFHDSEGQKWSAQAESKADQTNSMSMLIILVGSIIGISIGIYFAGSLSHQLLKITDAVDSSSGQVLSASEQLASASEKLSSSSQQQASSLEEASASLTEISGMAEANVTGAEHVDQAAKEVLEISQRTRQSMDQLSTAMGEILASNEKIEKLVRVISEIGEKTQVIDDIVFKTQLLSFNASVEAERAGEHGRGFSVVAQEVGNLAQLSGKAALEISTIVKNSIKEAEAVASENKSRVMTGGDLAGETKDQMGQVLTKLNNIIESISKIVNASKEQGSGIGQISTSVESISHLTQETASTAEETASSSSELSAQSAALMSSVDELKRVINGKLAEQRKNLIDKKNEDAPSQSRQFSGDATKPKSIETKLDDEKPVAGLPANKSGWDSL